jgi:hypothetical protein
LPILRNLNCMGAGEEAPPRVYIRAKPVPVTEGMLILCGRVKTLRVLLMLSDVTTRPCTGQTAIPTPSRHLVLREGSGTRSPRLTAGKPQL